MGAVLIIGVVLIAIAIALRAVDKHTLKNVLFYIILLILLVVLTAVWLYSKVAG